MPLNRPSITSIPSGISGVMSTFLLSIKNAFEADYPAKLPTFGAEELLATTPRLHSGKLVYCPNGNAGDPCLAYCDGLKWIVVTMGNRISLP